jgi:hypothetical protein
MVGATEDEVLLSLKPPVDGIADRSCLVDQSGGLSLPEVSPRGTS